MNLRDKKINQKCHMSKLVRLTPKIELREKETKRKIPLETYFIIHYLYFLCCDRDRRVTLSYVCYSRFLLINFRKKKNLLLKMVVLFGQNLTHQNVGFFEISSQKMQSNNIYHIFWDDFGKKYPRSNRPYFNHTSLSYRKKKNRNK